MLLLPRLRLLLVAGCVALLSGCGVAGSHTARVVHAEGVSGNVHGGQQPVAGATIQLYGVGTAGDGSAATALLTVPVLSGAGGNFTITGDYSCAGVSEVYLTATGGNPGLGTANPNLAEMVALGPCSALTAGTFVQVNELTTVAATSALAPYMTSIAAVGSDANDATALANAFALASEYVDPTAGATPGTGVPAGMSVPTSAINTLADILAGCVNSSGGAAGDNTTCGKFFAMTTPNGIAAPTNGIQALLNVAQNPTLNTSGLFALASPVGPYQPLLTAAPATFAVQLQPSYLLPGVSSLSFPVVPLGIVSSSQSVILVNATNAAVPVSGVYLTGAASGDYSLTTTCGASVAKGGTCAVAVTFAPTAAGTRNAAVVVNVPNSPVSVGLSGTGVAASTGPVSITPASLLFYERGTTQTVTLANNSANPLVISAINLGANWTQTNTCGQVLSENSACTISITAGSTVGQFSGSLTVVDGDTTDPQTVNLTTNALYTTLYSFDALSYGYDAPGVGVGMGSSQTYLSFYGGGYAQGYSLTLGGPNGGDFLYSSGLSACPPNASSGCTLQIYFNPTAVGTRYSLVATNGGVHYLFKGTGQSPTLTFTTSLNPLTFPITAVGSSSNRPVGLVVSFYRNISFKSITFTDSEFALNSDGCSGLDAYLDPNCNLSVSFKPTSAGTKSAVMTITPNNGPAQTVQLFGQGGSGPTAPFTTAFGNVAVGSTTTQTIKVTIPSQHLSVASLAGTGTPFAIPGSTVCATGAASCSFAVTFTPTALGTSSDTLTVTDAVTGIVATTALSGAGGVPIVSPSTTNLNFGLRNVGTTSNPETVTLTNTGNAPLVLTAVTLNNGDYATSNNCPASLAVNAQCVVTVTDTPMTTGDRAAMLTITSNGATVAIGLASTGN